MSEAVLIALVGAVTAAGGSGLTALVERHKLNQGEKTDASALLLQAQEQLTATMEDQQLLWQWNRELIDHIYRGAPPPPPRPPEQLFTH